MNGLQILHAIGLTYSELQGYEGFEAFWSKSLFL